MGRGVVLAPRLFMLLARAFRVEADSRTTSTLLLLRLQSDRCTGCRSGSRFTGLLRVHAHVIQQPVERDGFWQLKIAGADKIGGIFALLTARAQ